MAENQPILHQREVYLEDQYSKKRVSKTVSLPFTDGIS